MVTVRSNVRMISSAYIKGAYVLVIKIVMMDLMKKRKYVMVRIQLKKSMIYILVFVLSII